MPRRYAVTFTGQTIAAASGDYDLICISPADDKPCRLLGVWLGVSSELGDAAEEILRVDIIRGHTTPSSAGVGAFTPLTLDASGAAAGASVRIADSTIASGGTAVTLWALTFNVRAGLEWIPTPEMVPEVSQGNTTLVVRLMAAVADDLTMAATFIFEEAG